VLRVLLISTASHSSLADDHHYNKHHSRALADDDDQVVRGVYRHFYINDFPIPLTNIPS